MQLLRPPPPSPPVLFRRNPNFLSLKRRRRRKSHHHIRSSLDELITNPNSLYLLAPALGLISGASFFLSSIPRTISRAEFESINDWILLTSPTPFNRSVFLRCPSISFESDTEFSKTERHHVHLSTTKTPISHDEEEEEEDLSYQRICVRTKDGGVISLDWPESLDLREQHGLDTTLIIVPGSPKGSKEKKIKLLLKDALRHGYFPIVMNPRGCAGSPVTTPRLFTAADSDDISIVIRFLNTVRPWTTLMGASWGHGSNMLIKYLSEVGESTPLTAAVCIDNIFDLNEATKLINHRLSLDQEITSGLIDILEANKELFQGKEKGFDFQQGLTAVSLRDFDEAISMVSHGCDSLDDFYAKCSNIDLIPNIKIPLLFIHSGNGAVPAFTVPCEDISSNPYTSLILSSLPFGVYRSDKSATMRCQQLVIEWLSAVELSLLKGRNPLIKNLDIFIKPSKTLPIINNNTDNNNNKSIVKNTKSHRRMRYPGSNSNSNSNSNSSLVLNGSLVKKRYLVGPTEEKKEIKEGDFNLIGEKNEIERELSEQEEEENSQVLQTASVVMNMLDVTMPGTLNDEQKEKVLTAMEKGETLMKALQEAVPDDVRGKLTMAASEIIKNKKLNINLESLKGIRWTKTSSQENNNHNVNNNNSAKVEIKEPSDQVVITDSDMSNLSSEESVLQNFPNVDSVVSNDVNTPKDEVKKVDSPNVDPVVSNDVNAPKDEKKVDSSNVEQNVVTPNRNEMERQINEGNKNEEVNNDENTPKDEVKRVDSPNDVNTPKDEVKRVDSPNGDPVASNDVNTPKDEVKKVDSPNSEQNAVNEANKNGEVNNNNNNNSNNTNNTNTTTNNNSINVTQALDALTGFDDSTQMAVNSVFGVIENMIDELEKKQENEDEDENENKNDEANEGTKDQDDVIQNNVVKIEKQQHSDDILPKEKGDFGDDYLNNEILERTGDVQSLYKSMHNSMYFDKYVSKQLKAKKKELVFDSATDLFLDPTEGKWKIVDQVKNIETESDNYDYTQLDSVIEPSYVILENDDVLNQESEINSLGDDAVEKVTSLIRDELFRALETELCQKLGISDLEKVNKDLFSDIDELSSLISENVVLNSELNLVLFPQDVLKEKIGTIEGGFMIKMVSNSIQEANNLKKILPLGVIFGIILSCLRKYFLLSESDDNGENEGQVWDELMSEKSLLEEVNGKKDEGENGKKEEGQNGKKEDIESVNNNNNNNNNNIMVGAVTAALGASALLVQHEKQQLTEESDNHRASNNQKGFLSEEQENNNNNNNNNNNIISSLAEKAMSVAGPVVPTKSGGEVDHERLVAVLAELGQRGGMLRFVGKLALLWGGIRGAMSLTDRLISFLKIGERPLFHRFVGFVGMALVLWSPIVIPLLPTLVQSWTTKSSTGIVGYACVIGLYVNVTILVMLWGRRIRGYDNPMQQYGLDVTLTQGAREFLKGLVGGVIIVLSIHSINVLLGYASFSWPPQHVPFLYSNTISVLKSYGNELAFIVRGLVTATGVSLVEELLFRSWLVEEIAVDYGYLRAFILSGILFSLIHRSMRSIPGYILFSLFLSGMKQMSKGKLVAPIGMRAGIMTTSYALHATGLVRFKPNLPFWLVCSHPLHPFNGAVGLVFCLLLAVIFWPDKPFQNENDLDGVHHEN